MRRSPSAERGRLPAMASGEKPSGVMDRRGVEVGRLGDEGVDYEYVALSHDALRVAVALRDWRTGRRDLWLMDTQQPMRERLTVDAPDAGFPGGPGRRARAVRSTRNGSGTSDRSASPAPAATNLSADCRPARKAGSAQYHSDGDTSCSGTATTLDQAAARRSTRLSLLNASDGRSRRMADGSPIPCRRAIDSST